MKSLVLYKTLWGYIAEHRRIQIGLYFAVLVVASFAEVMSIGAVLPFLGVLMSPDHLFLSPIAQHFIAFMGVTEPRDLVLPLTLVFIVAALFSGFMRLFLLWAQARLGFAIGADLSIDIYKRTLYQPYSTHIERNSSEVINGIANKSNAVIYNIILPLLIVASSALILVAIIVSLFVIDPIIALVSFIGFGSIYGLLMVATRSQLAKDSKRISCESTQVIKALQEGLGGIRDVLLDGTQGVYCQIYRQADLPMRRSQANIQIISGAPRFLIESIGIVLISILAYKMVVSDSGIASAIPILGALALGAQRLLPVMQQLYSNWSNIRGGEACLRDVLQLLNQPIPKDVDKNPPLLMPFEREIVLNDVSFRYSTNSQLVLQRINLQITKGNRVGFIGATGSGKSTLVDLIMGLLRPVHGVLTVDGEIVTERNCRSWQEHIAHVPQSIFLADISIAENIAFGCPRELINLERVRKAARQAQIDNVIEALDRKYDSLVGERGVRLSGGQRQRIGIARALYRESDVIVFDEATSALDIATESALMEAINNIDGEVTILIIAHRLATLRNCDQIVELEHGRIKRVGTYDEIVLSLR